MKEQEINLLGIRPNGTILCHSDSIKGCKSIIFIKPISEEEEERIDNSIKYYGELRYIKDDNIIIRSKNIYIYGEVDLNKQEDIDIINKFNFIDKGDSSNWMYSTFNFDKGVYSLINGEVKGSPTWNCLNWFKYCYTLIGKPKRIIIYKDKI